MTDPSIHQAAVSGDLDRVRALLDKDPALVDQDDPYHWRPIFHAGLYKHLAVVELLIERGADLGAHDGYVLHYAGQVPENKAVVTLLLQYGALEAHVEPESQAAREFIHAVFMANAARVQAMLNAAPELVLGRYARGDTALHHACRNGDLAVVQALVEAGADVNTRTEHEPSPHFPLYCAAGHGHAESTVYLLEHGADIEMQLADGKNITEWLAQYAEHDARYQRCLAALAPFQPD